MADVLASFWLAIVTLTVSVPAASETAYCRLDSQPWIGCRTETLSAGALCACPTAGGDVRDARGHVRLTSDEDFFMITSESTKLALGITRLSGPVVAFVPKALSANREQARTPEQQQMLQIYDFFQFHNLARPENTVFGTSSSDSHLTPARSLLRAKDIPPPNLGAYGVVALKAKPTPATKTRLDMLCQSFLASLPRQQSLPESVPLSQQMITIWPVEDSEGGIEERCDPMLDHYDLYSGQSAIADANAQGKKLSGRGPFLIGWAPSNSRHIPDAVVLVVDMSDFETQASFDEALLFWQQKVIEDPTLWRSGFSVEGIRLAARDFVDRYGPDILKALKIGGE